MYWWKSMVLEGLIRSANYLRQICLAMMEFGFQNVLLPCFSIFLRNLEDTQYQFNIQCSGLLRICRCHAV